MLYDFGLMLIEMLSNEVDDNNKLVGTIDDILNNLDIEPELKAIIYECLHAKDKVSEREQEAYDNEINQFILKDRMKRQQAEQN